MSCFLKAGYWRQFTKLSDHSKIIIFIYLYINIYFLHLNCKRYLICCATELRITEDFDSPYEQIGVKV